jgi:hemin uptake protein HemP
MGNADRDPPDSQEPSQLAAAQEPATSAAAADNQRDEAGPIQSESLLRGRSEIQILHRGELYRLCLTRAGKLILHK